MKKSIYLLLINLSFLNISNAQHIQHSINAGYVVGLSRDMGHPFMIGIKDETYGNKNGFYFGSSIETKKYTFSANFLTHVGEVKNPIYLEQAQIYTRFNYLQVSAKRHHNLHKKLQIGYGVASNINIYSNSKYTSYFPDGKIYKETKSDYILIVSDPSNLGKRGSQNQMQRFSLNINTNIAFKITERIRLNIDYQFPLTPTNNNIFSKGSTSGFYQSSVNMGLSFRLVKNKS